MEILIVKKLFWEKTELLFLFAQRYMSRRNLVIKIYLSVFVRAFSKKLHKKA